MSDSDDENLARAIALSLGQNVPCSQAQKHTPAVIDISSDDESDDLDAPLVIKSNGSKKVLAASEQNNRATSKLSEVTNNIDRHSVDSREASSQELPSQSFTHANSTPLSPILSNDPASFASNTFEKGPLPHGSQTIIHQSSQNGLLGLNRKQMEEERLQRASQRMVREVPLKDSQGHQKRKRSPQTPELLNDRHIKPKASRSTSSQILPKVSSFRDQKFLGSSGIQFPDGVVKKTWAYGYPRENDIKIEEVLQKDDLELAVLSAFQVEPEWVISKLNPSTKVVWVLQAKTEWEKKNFESEAPANYKFCFPSMKGQINCMHSKLQLLSHPTYLRVVVPSANLVPYDWGETGVMENIIFMIDLPRIPAEKLITFNDLTEFGKELRYFLDAMGLDTKISDSLLKFDFSRTANLRFVHSIGGSHSGEHWKRTGYCGLGRAIQSLGLQTKEAIDIDLVSASIGNLNDSFVKAIYLAAQGDDGMTEYDWRTKKLVNGTTMMAAQQMVSSLIKERFRLYFPTRDTVAQSRGGIGAGGTICFQSKWYNAVGFPRYLMRDCKSQRPGLLMHNKMLFVRPGDPDLSAWSYLGSANLSESAWGRLVQDKTTKEPKLNLRNWECGVILQVSKTKVVSGGKTTEMSVFSETIPVPMVTPGDMYRSDQQPWYYNHEQ